LNALELNWVGTAYLLAAAAFLVPFGRFADIYGRKKVFQIGILIDAVASIFCAISSSGAWLIIFRALQGLGGAMIFGTGVAILTSVFPANKRGKALGINTAAVYVGLSAGPMIGGFLTGSFGWRSIFLLNALLGLVITLIVFWKLKGEWAGAKGEKFDYIGTVMYVLALVAVIYAFSVLPAFWGIWLIIIGLIGLIAFVRWEMRQQQPVLNIGFFRNNTAFAFSNLAAFINYAATYAVAFLLSLYLQYIKGFAPEYAGLIIIAQPVVMVICSPIAGSLSDRIEPRIVASLGMAMTTIGLIMLIFLGTGTGLTFILSSLVVLGLGFGFFSSPNVNAIMGSVPAKSYGVAASTLGTMRLTGQALSMGMSLLLFAMYIGKAQITPEYYSLFLKSMRVAFTVSAALCFAGIFASIARGRTRRQSA
jgi:EmrB/QacA subfamily drug resistance transporter